MKQLTKNIVALVGSDLTRKFFGFLTVAYLTRHVSISDFGLINIGLTILSYVLIFSSAGIPALAAREIARSTESSLIGRVLSTRFLLTIFSIVVTSLLIFFFVPERSVALFIIVFTLASIPNAFFLDWYFQGKESMGSIGASRGVSAVVSFLIIFFIVKSSADVIWVALAAIVGDLCASVMYFLFARNFKLTFNIKFDAGSSLSLIKQSFPLGLGSILAHASVNLSPLFIGIVLTTFNVGIFSAANKLVFFLMIFDRLLSTLLLPATSRIFSQHPEQFKQRLEETQKWVLLIALPICIGGTALANEIIPFVFGGAYALASKVFSILVWFLLMTMLHTVYSSGLVAIGKEKEFAKVMIVGSMLYVSFIVIGTLLFQETGAAVAMVLAETCTVVFTLLKLQHHIKLSPPTSFLQIVLSLLAMTLALHFLVDLHFLMKILVGAIVYVTVSFSIKAVSLNEIKTMLSRVW
ncbi:MAG: flippase [Ignavibacteriales bacterium]|nr:flippase [Ignavibacteriales bacterium]